MITEENTLFDSVNEAAETYYDLIEKHKLTKSIAIPLDSIPESGPVQNVNIFKFQNFEIWYRTKMRNLTHQLGSLSH